jgi:signal transduction histidine kinase
MFSRAANIIRRNCNYDGVVIFDSTISTFDGQMQTTSGKNSHHPTEPHSKASPICHVLGFSSNDTTKYPPCAESDLHTLLESHPTGQIYNISETGEVTVDELSSTTAMTKKLSSHGINGVRMQNLRKRAEAETIRKVAPAARSVAFFPLYDYQRGRWFAGCFCYTRDVNRVLSPELDLLYLRAFGNSMMTELSRLDAISLDQAKTTFVASISHELRSPLHGILGGVEVLQDTAIDDFQTSMVTSIDVCGRTLLNTINHVMDFAKINAFATQKVTSKSGDKSKKRPTDMTSLTSIVDLSVVIEETVEAVFLGESYRITHMTNSDPDSHPPARGGNIGDLEGGRKILHVVLDMPCRENWRFKTQPGSWKRILMNTFGNALKYSETGFVHVSLKFEEGDGDSDNINTNPHVVITVSDSGIGISQDFLQNQLYKPFSQENSFATGTGLGLSIVRGIVDSMGGNIAIKSQQKVGTEVKVSLPIPEAHPALEPDPKSREAMMAIALKGICGKKITIYNRQVSEPESKARKDSVATGESKVTDSLFATLTQWLGLKASVSSEIPPDGTDVILCTGPSFDFLSMIRKKYTKGKVPVVLFLAVDTLESATLRADARITSKESIVEIITQP